MVDIGNTIIYLLHIMTIENILRQPDDVIKNHIQELASEYKSLTGYEVCLSCKGDIRYMVSQMKKIYSMKNFEFKNPRVMYKIEKGSSDIISNERMTDEKAIRFLQKNPSRIELFRTYPENWKELIGLEEAEKEQIKSEEPVKTSSTKSTKKSGGCSGCKDKKSGTKKATKITKPSED